MSNIIIPEKNKDFGKACPHWCPLKDGTMTGDPIYCDRSLECRQTDAFGQGYISHWYKFRDVNGVEAFDYFCTGMYLNIEKEEKNVDEEVS